MLSRATCKCPLDWLLTSKSVAFFTRGTSPRLEQVCVRSQLKAMPVIKDLGVPLGSARATKDLATKRWVDATSRLKRIALLALPFAGRVRLVATSALTAAVYGSTAKLTPLQMIHGMRRWVKVALWRGSHFVALQLLHHSGDLLWRADLVALVVGNAVEFLANALNSQALDLELLVYWRPFVSLRGQGPLSACKSALAALSATFDGLRFVRQGEHSQEVALDAPWSLAPVTRRTWLLQARLDRDLKQLRKLRPGLHPDLVPPLLPQVASIRRSLHLSDTPAAALRGVQCGDFIGQATAKHWREGEGLRLHCGQEVETPIHRWFHCAAWARARSAVLGAQSKSVLTATLPAITLSNALPTVPRHLNVAPHSAATRDCTALDSAAGLD